MSNRGRIVEHSRYYSIGIYRDKAYLCKRIQDSHLRSKFLLFAHQLGESKPTPQTTYETKGNGGEEAGHIPWRVKNASETSWVCGREGDSLAHEKGGRHTGHVTWNNPLEPEATWDRIKETNHHFQSLSLCCLYFPSLSPFCSHFLGKFLWEVTVLKDMPISARPVSKRGEWHPQEIREWESLERKPDLGMMGEALPHQRPSLPFLGGAVLWQGASPEMIAM